jgi:hypothetical protein
MVSDLDNRFGTPIYVHSDLALENGDHADISVMAKQDFMEGFNCCV